MGALASGISKHKHAGASISGSHTSLLQCLACISPLLPLLAEEDYLRALNKTFKPKPDPGMCVDLHEMCEQWAKSGECEKNKDYMVRARCVAGRARGRSVQPPARPRARSHQPPHTHARHAARASSHWLRSNLALRCTSSHAHTVQVGDSNGQGSCRLACKDCTPCEATDKACIAANRERGGFLNFDEAELKLVELGTRLDTTVG